VIGLDALLALRSFLERSHTQAADETLFITVRPRFAQYMQGFEDDALRRTADYQGVISELAQLHHVRGVTYGAPLLSEHSEEISPSLIVVDGRTLTAPIVLREVGAGYLGALGVPLLMGRDLRQEDTIRCGGFQAALAKASSDSRPSNRSNPRSDQASLPAPAVIDSALSTWLWAEENPIGRRFQYGGLRIGYEVVGVIGELKHGGPVSASVGTLVTCRANDQDDGINPQSVVVRTSVPVNRDLVRAARQLVSKYFPNPAQLEMRTGAEVLGQKSAREEMTARLISSYAAITFLLVILGVYARVQYSVQNSRRTLAIRAALGASQLRLFWEAVKQPAVGTAAGLAAGILAALAASRLLRAVVAGFGSDSWRPHWIAAAMISLAVLAAMVAATREIRRLQSSILVRE
jgi:hypothetical protein